MKKPKKLEKSGVPGDARKAYGSRPTNRARRGRADMQRIREAIADVLEAEHPATVRQVFYQLVSRGAIAKTEAEYKATVVRLLTDMRLAGEVPFDWISDNTRWMRKPRTFSSVEQALRRTAETYRRSLWDRQAVYVEIWLEKDALAGVLYQITELWDVPLMVTRGYASLSYLHGAAEAIGAQGKPAYIYYFGDHDPSGVDIPRTVEARLREFAPAADIHFERVAVTEQQIRELSLPTRPTKKTDSRSKNFVGESVEVDAIPPTELRRLVDACIVRHVGEQALEVNRVAEESERAILLRMTEALTQRVEMPDGCLG
jgi:hypothetical protein